MSHDWMSESRWMSKALKIILSAPVQLAFFSLYSKFVNNYYSFACFVFVVLCASVWAVVSATSVLWKTSVRLLFMLFCVLFVICVL